MYETEKEMWISVDEMHFEGATSCWFPSIEPQVDSLTWEKFYDMISGRFDRNQHEVLLRKLHNIKHTASVAEYVTEFTTLVEKLTAYVVAVGPIYFASDSLMILRQKIHSILIV